MEHSSKASPRWWGMAAIASGNSGKSQATMHVGNKNKKEGENREGETTKGHCHLRGEIAGRVPHQWTDTTQPQHSGGGISRKGDNRSSSRWFQIEGRMDRNFFTCVRNGVSLPPIQLLRSHKGVEYTTTHEMSRYTNNYFRNLFQIQGMYVESMQARRKWWDAIPRKIDSGMIQLLIKPVS